MGTLVKAVHGSPWDITGKNDYIDEWFLMRSPAPVLAIVLTYIIFVLKLGPGYMKYRPPFELRKILVAYNALQVLISCYMFYTGFKLLWKYGLINQDCVSDSKDLQWQVASNYYCYFLAKITELLDTIFFVLRKRYRQVSFLHVYHHSGVIIFSWLVIKFDPSEITVFIATINSFIHIIMYGYYALSAFPSLNKYLWWKAYITQLQLIQFILILAQATMFYKYSRCSSTYMTMGFVYFNMPLMIVLFGNFYIKSYLKNNVEQSNGIKNNRKDNKNVTEDCTNGKHEKKKGVHTNGKHNGIENRKDKNGINGFSNGSHIKRTQY